MNLISWLHGLYLFTSIFGIGVMAIDMLGLLGTGEGDADGAADGGGHMPVLSVLRYLRLAVYFSLGFGPLGLVAEATGSGGLWSLLWSVPGGVAAGILARLFFRFQQDDIDSSVQEDDLLLERGRVIVPLSSQNMGKVRVKMGQIVVERYALAEDEWESLQTDEVVEIVRVTDDCVYVRRSEGNLLSDDGS
ncbi:MAG: hypothetical protein O7G88_15350 [bacterium]|nr:hypothetical protein [bacterium]